MKKPKLLFKFLFVKIPVGNNENHPRLETNIFWGENSTKLVTIEFYVINFLFCPSTITNRNNCETFF